MKVDLVPIVKGVSSLIASAGIGAVVENAVRSTTPAKLSKYGILLTVIGRIVLTSYLSDKASEYVEKRIDEAVERTKKQKKGEDDAYSI